MLLSMPQVTLEARFGIEKAARIAKEAGFDALDYAMYHLVYNDSALSGENWRDRAKEIRAAADNAGIVFNQTHAPFQWDGKQYNDEKTFNEVIVPRITRGLEVASILGAKVCVVHPFQAISYADHAEELFERNMDFYRRLLPFAHEYGVKVAVENMWQYDSRRKCIIDSCCSRLEEFIRYIDTLDDEYAVACLDIGHVGLIERKDEAWDVIRGLGHERLQSLHLHDNSYRGDDHVIPYLGKIDWDEVTRALGEIDYTGDFTYETDNFNNNIPEDFVVESTNYMARLGRYLMKKVDANRPAK